MPAHMRKLVPARRVCRRFGAASICADDEAADDGAAGAGCADAGGGTAQFGESVALTCSKPYFLEVNPPLATKGHALSVCARKWAFRFRSAWRSATA